MPVQVVKNKPIIIGLTGGIATGKSTVCQYVLRLGYTVIDSDAIVKTLWESNHSMLEDIKSLFHTLDKKAIASKIFDDASYRKQLNKLVHPYVFKEIKKQLKKRIDDPIVIIDMPLLFEVGYQNHVDYTVVVYTDSKTALSRLMMRDGLTKKNAEKRIAAQMPIEDKKEKADYLLNNMQDKASLYEAIDHMLRSILNEE